MRAIWKGAVSFGLVNIPVRLYTATEERDVTFHQVHRQDGARVRYKRICQADGAEVAFADIAKGYELPTGEVVVLSDEDFADLPLPTSRTVEVLEFVPLEQVDPIYFAKSYYLEPDKQGTKSYVLLRDALDRSGMVALVKVAIRTREALATLRTRDGVLVLETMVWPDEVRTPDFGFLDEEISPRPQELTMATSLIDSMSGDFDPSQYHDQYRDALAQVIEAKIAGREVVEPGPEVAPPSERAVDLMAALRRSVAEAKQRRGAASGEPGASESTAGATGSEETGSEETRAGRAATKAKKSTKTAKADRTTKKTRPAKPAKATKAGKEAPKPKKAAARGARKAADGGRGKSAATSAEATATGRTAQDKAAKTANKTANKTASKTGKKTAKKAIRRSA